MTINPRDYDLDELREMARGRNDTPRNAPNGDGEEDAASPDLDGGWGSRDAEAMTVENLLEEQFDSDIHRELLPLEAGEDDLEKPYLEQLPESYAAEIVIFEWLEFLLNDFGYQGANEALQYYESVGWLTEDIETSLNDYLVGINEPDTNRMQDGDIDSHKLSLVYIARLVSMN